MSRWLNLIWLLIAHPAMAQQVQLVVPDKPVVVGTAFQVQYVVINSDELTETTAPVFQDMKIVSGPYRYKGQTIQEGKTRPVENITYTLVPLKTGKLSVGGITVSFRNGVQVASGNAMVTVEPLPKASFNPRSSYTDVNLYAPPSHTDLDELIREHLFIKVQVNKKTCYVGEPIEVSFVLYSSLQSTSAVVNSPSLYGFSVMDVLDIHQAHRSVETVKGKVFNKAILRKMQLYPEHPGVLLIDEMELMNTIEFEDLPNKAKKTRVEKKLVSAPVSIHVAPLPSKRPEDYTGAVGSFVLEARLEQQKLETGKQGLLWVTVSGRGNFIQFSPPPVKWPPGFEVLEPVVSDTFNKNMTPVEGRRTYQFRFIADSAGSYVIPPLRFSFFDTDSGLFKTLRTDSLLVTVVKGAEQNQLVSKDEGLPATGGRPVAAIVATLTAALAVLYYFLRKKRKKPEPQFKTFTLSERLHALDLSGLSDKQACVEIENFLSQAIKKYPSLTGQNRKAIDAIRSDCQLVAYSSLEAGVKKEELKARTLEVLRELESTYSAYL